MTRIAAVAVLGSVVSSSGGGSLAFIGAAVGQTPCQEIVDNVQDLDVTQGNNDAPVTLIEYGSLDCPNCAMFDSEDTRIIREYIQEGSLRFIFRQYPLSNLAKYAAMLAVSSGRFFDVAATLMARREDWVGDSSGESLMEVAGQLGFNEDEIRTVVADRQLLQEITYNQRCFSLSLHITGTPTLFINEERYDGYPNPETLEELIKKHLDDQ